MTRDRDGSEIEDVEQPLDVESSATKESRPSELCSWVIHMLPSEPCVTIR